MKAVRILAPAKLNLGLAILGKRDDGYHEIDTIMAMIDLCDEITISESTTPGITISGMDDIPTESNLMWKAAQLWSNATGISPAWKIEIRKRIPSPAGIGGGSSDAVATLKALNQLYGKPLVEAHLHEVAAQIGSDCPFFLGGACARATGTGTDISPLDPPTGWAVLAVPEVRSQSKTASLFGNLTSQDYGESASIDDVTSHIREGSLAGRSLPNSFLRPALGAFPDLHSLISKLSEMGGNASLSGSGPAIYATTSSEQDALSWSQELEQSLASDIAIHVVQFLQRVPEPEFLRVQS